MYFPLNWRIRSARRHARRLQTQDRDTDTSSSEVSLELILQQLGPKLLVHNSDDIIVTESGFVTMALLTVEAGICKGLLVIPGVDDSNQTGHLVLRDGFVPYHSLCKSIDQAVVDAQLAWARAKKLEQHFGSKSDLRQAAAAAPWYLLSRYEDAARAGLCQWGSESFLRRMCMQRFCKAVGLPRFLTRLAGTYGSRVTAATLQRHEQQYCNESLFQERLR